MASNVIRAESTTYREDSLTDQGWILTLYSDGGAAAEWRNRWQGGRNGIRFRCEPGAFKSIDELDELFADVGIDDVFRIPGWRQTHRGYVVL